MKETGAEDGGSSGAYRFIHIFIFKFMLSKHLLFLFLFISNALHMFIWEWFLAHETILLAYGTIYFYYNGTKFVFIFFVQNCKIKTCLNDKIHQLCPIIHSKKYPIYTENIRIRKVWVYYPYLWVASNELVKHRMLRKLILCRKCKITSGFCAAVHSTKNSWKT